MNISTIVPQIVLALAILAGFVYLARKIWLNPILPFLVFPPVYNLYRDYQTAQEVLATDALDDEAMQEEIRQFAIKLVGDIAHLLGVRGEADFDQHDKGIKLVNGKKVVWFEYASLDPVLVSGGPQQHNNGSKPKKPANGTYKRPWTTKVQKRDAKIGDFKLENGKYFKAVQGYHDLEWTSHHS